MRSEISSYGSDYLKKKNQVIEVTTLKKNSSYRSDYLKKKIKLSKWLLKKNSSYWSDYLKKIQVIEVTT